MFEASLSSQQLFEHTVSRDFTIYTEFDKEYKLLTVIKESYKSNKQYTGYFFGEWSEKSHQNHFNNATFWDLLH